MDNKFPIFAQFKIFVMLKHIVFFKFRASEDKEARMNEIKFQLENLIHEIPELKKMQVGLNMNPAEKWDLVLEAIVENMHTLEIYANHPAHQNIVKTLIAPIKEDRAAIDFIF